MLSFFPRDVLDEILDLTDSVSEGFPTYSFNLLQLSLNAILNNFDYTEKYGRVYSGAFPA